jgi:hypothetical protein
MVITHHGKQFVKLQVGDVVVAYNPISKESKEKSSKFGADIGLVSLNHPDFNGTDQLSYGEKTPFIISGPGEYEVKEIFIKGFPVETTYHGEKKINTAYSVLFEGINVCFLGALPSAAAITADLKEKLGDIGILFVPICGGDVCSVDEANKVAVNLEANIIIPMDYDDTSLKTFLKEGGDGAEVLDKLTIKKKDLMERQGDIVVLKSIA